ncbi:class I SAM-dependent methyltransferase [Ferrimonas gelatinilytica]|uniref:Methyltransferase domain-containing protein n=1 Tax=Ferrimonas gelatinilytica TaxID=1255257 RepID=A0ABP9S711_9GAMM
MAHTRTTPNALLQAHLDAFEQLPSGPVLDLACGHGRHGMTLAKRGLPVWFCDINTEALAAVQAQLDAQRLAATLWRRDLEAPEVAGSPLGGRRFSAIIVVNYLHRPLLPKLAEAIMPGGLILYETFLAAQAEIGRPRNPDFLLQPGELIQPFASWDRILYREGRWPDPDRFTAQLVARKPR